jgi:hypothetical protein
MLLEIENNIDEAIAHFARRCEGAGMITTRPYRASSSQHPIDRTSHPNGHTRHASAERPSVVGLDDEVDMVVLHGEVHEAKPGARRLRESAPNRAKNRLSAQTWQRSYGAQSHVNRLPSTVRRAPAMACS